MELNANPKKNEKLYTLSGDQNKKKSKMNKDNNWYG